MLLLVRVQNALDVVRSVSLPELDLFAEEAEHEVGHLVEIADHLQVAVHLVVQIACGRILLVDQQMQL